MNKRTFLKTGATLTTLLAFQPWRLRAQPEVPIDPDEDDLPWRNTPNRTKEFTLPPLPYAIDALEPHFDKVTMEIHHEKHHAAYIKNLNEAVKNTVMATQSIEQILATVSDKLPVVRNNAGGHYNHTLFWTSLKPNGGGAPTGNLAEEINAAFGSLDKFKEIFNKTAMSRFGSGWAWLTADKITLKLSISSTANQDNPLMAKIKSVEKKGVPILGLDVWEHAYYLKYQNKRADYINAFWQVVNWGEVAERLKAIHSNRK